MTAAQSCPTIVPTTNVIRYYDFTITRASLAPDGVAEEVLIVNGEFPGPLIEANWGDLIHVNVHNEITGPEEGTVMHWHGMNQLGTPWADGVATISHCPIVPGTSFTFGFRATQPGTSWWHSHLSSQYGSGLQGPMVIYGPTSAPYDIDLGPIILTDWYHEDYEDILVKVMSNMEQYPNGFVPYDSAGLINGKGYYPCANVSTAPCDNTGGPLDLDNGTCTEAPSCGVAGLSEFRFISGKKHLLRLVNTAAEMFVAFSIDNHTMTVVSNDFSPIEPYTTNVVTLGVGQRSDVIVEANGDPSEAYWMRSTINGVCSPTQNPDTRAVIYYEKADTSFLPQTTGQGIPPNTGCFNDNLTLTVPSCPISIGDPDHTFEVDITFKKNATGSSKWFMNGIDFQGNYNNPLLLSVFNGNTDFPAQRNVYNLGNYSTIRLIINNHFIPAHPMHLHSHDYQILAAGPGSWDGTITNPQNPNRRDIEMLGGNASPATQTHIVVQWKQDNPGVWPMHCHIAWHLSGGLGINLVERPDDIMGLNIPQEYFNTCPTFGNWQQSHNNIADELDSGQ